MTAQPQRTSQAPYSFCEAESFNPRHLPLDRLCEDELRLKIKEKRGISSFSFWAIAASSFLFYSTPIPTPGLLEIAGLVWRQYLVEELEWQTGSSSKPHSAGGLVYDSHAQPPFRKLWWAGLCPGVVIKISADKCMYLVCSRYLINGDLSCSALGTMNGTPSESKGNGSSLCGTDFTVRKWDLHR